MLTFDKQKESIYLKALVESKRKVLRARKLGVPLQIEIIYIGFELEKLTSPSLKLRMHWI